MRKCAASLMHLADTAFPLSSCRRTPTLFLRSPRPRSWHRQYPFRRLRQIQRRRMPKPMAAVALVPRGRSWTRMAGAGAGQMPSTGIGSGHRSVNSKPRAGAVLGQPQCWCGRRDLNPHDLRHWNLNPARLPIPPRPHRWEALRHRPKMAQIPKYLKQSALSR